jgi:hypothetical protein
MSNEKRVSLTLFLALSAALTLLFSPNAGAALVNFGAPNTMSVGWEPAPKALMLASAASSNSVPDLFTYRGQAGAASLEIRQSNLTGEYRYGVSIPGYVASVQNLSIPGAGTPLDMDVADVNGDNNPDIVVGSTVTVQYAKGAANGSYGSLTLPAGAPAGLVSGTKIANADGDSLPDLLTVSTGQLRVFYNTTSTSTPFDTYTNEGAVPVSANGLAVADFDADGNVDAAVTSTDEQRLTMRFATTGPSPAPFGLLRSIGLYTRPGAMTAANVTGNSRPELIVAEPDKNAVAIVSFDSASGVIGPITQLPTGLFPQAVTTADLDGDGVREIIVANAGSNSVTVADVGGASPEYPAGQSPNTVSVGSMNDDARPDLLVSNDGNGSVSTLLNLGVPVAPPPPAVKRTASLKCSAKKSKGKIREISCAPTLSNKADAKSLSATLSLGKKKLRTVKASAGKKFSFKYSKGLKAGSYSVKLTVKNADGTSITAKKTVKIK